MRTASSAIVIATLGALTVGCSEPQAVEPTAPRPVKAHTVGPAPLETGIRYSASIEPFEQVSVAFKANGYVEEVMRRTGADGRSRALQPGDRIERGSVLARVQPRDYVERVNQGKAKLAEGEASLVKAQLDLARAKTLFEAESLIKPDLDAAQAAHAGAEARIAAARAEVELAASALRESELVAPTSGVVIERRIEVGSLAAAGTIAFIVGDVSAVKARFGIPDMMIRSVTPGDPISVIVESAGAERFAGRVTAIAPVADKQSRVFDVEVTIDNRNGRLRPGMIGAVTVGQPAAALADASRPVTVPLNAVVRAEAGSGQFAVMVVEQKDAQETARLRRVELGEVIGNAITIRSGIAAGERVIVSGSTLLLDGERVRTVPEAD